MEAYEQYLEQAKNIGLYLTIGLFVFALIGLLISMRKGIYKNIFNLVAIVTSLLLSFLAAGILINTFVADASIQNLLSSLFETLEKVNVPADALLAIGEGLVLVVALPLVFLPIYLIVKVIFYFPYRIWVKRFDTKKWALKPIGMVLGFLTGAILLLVLTSPIFTLLNLVGSSVDSIPKEAIVYCQRQEASESEEEIPEEEGSKNDGDILAMVDEFFPMLVTANEYMSPYCDSIFYKLTSNIGWNSLYSMAPIDTAYEGNSINDLDALLNSAVTLASYVYCDIHMEDFIDTFVDGDISDEMDEKLNAAMYGMIDSDLLTDVLGGFLSKGLGMVSTAMKLDEQTKTDLESSVKFKDADTLTNEQKENESEQVAEVIRVLLSALPDLIAMTDGGEEGGDTLSSALDHFGTLGHLMDVMDRTYSFGDSVEELLYALSEMEIVTKYVSRDTIQDIINSRDTYENIMNTLAATVKMAQSGMGGLS